MCKVNENPAQSRVRMNCSLTAKGLVQWEVTSEFPTVEEASSNLLNAIEKCRETIKKAGLKEVQEKE